MKISKSTIDKIFDTVIIEDVIAEFVNLKKTGANYKGLSPFNDEKTPSFVVSPSKEIWKDFSSGKGGNVISFLMELEQFSYPEALLFLAEKYNIQVEYDQLDPQQKEQENERQATIIVLNFIKSIFMKQLVNNQVALDYLQLRGFTQSTIDKFAIGYSAKSDNSIVLDTKNAGYNVKYLTQARIVNDRGINRFGGRIMFPIFSLTGDVLGFGGRLLDNKEQSVKYLNSDSSDLYQKSKILYGMHLAKKHIKKLDFCYLVEGYTDVMALYQHGIQNVVSSCGTALTHDQIRLIRRFTKNIVILFDSDSAGIKATIKAIDETLRQGFTPKILQLPKTEDPASFFNKNKTDFINKYIEEQTIDFIDFKLKLITHRNPEELIKITKSIMHSIFLIEDPISKTFYIKSASKKIGINESALLEHLDNQPNEKSIIRSNKTNKSELDLEYIQKNYLEELQLIRLLISYGSVTSIMLGGARLSVAEFILAELEKDNKDIDTQFSIPIFNIIFSHINQQISLNEEVTIDSFLNHKNPSVRFLSSHLIGQKHLLSNWGGKDIEVVQEEDILLKVTKEAILRFKLKRIQQMIEMQLLTLKNTEEDKVSVLKKFSQLSAVEKKIQKKLGRIF